MTSRIAQWVQNLSPLAKPGGFRVIADHHPGSAVRRRSHLFQDSGDIRFDDVPDARVTVSRFQLPNLSVGRVSSTGHEVAISESDALTLLLPVEGRLLSEIRGTEHSARPGQLLFLPPDWRKTKAIMLNRNRFKAHVFIVPHQLLAAQLGAHGIASPARLISALRSSAFQQGSDAGAAELVDLLGILCQDIDRGARSTLTETGKQAWEHLVLDKLVDLLLPDTLPPPLPHSRAALAARAVDYIQANFATIESVEEIASACGVGRRALEVAFRQSRQITPAEALRDHRLNVARQMLGSAPWLSVTDVALSCGFSHLSRFAQQYRQRFGELPSERRRIN